MSSVYFVVIVLLSTKCPPKPDLRWWQHATFYELWLPSFKDSDGDGGGDLAGVREKLRYLSKNVKPTALYIRPPIFKSTECCPGFWVQNFREIQPEFGTMTDFDNLVNAAHSRGIRIVIDFPIAAVDTYHEWFQTGASHFSEYFLWIKNKTIIEGNKTVDCEKGRCFKSTPDDHGAVLNWHYEPLRRALLDEVKFWLDRNVDGVHLSSVEHLIRRKHYKTGDLEKISGYLREFIVQLKQHANDRELFVFMSLNRTSTKNLTVDEFKAKLTPKSSGFDAILRDSLLYIDRKCRSLCLREILEKSSGTKIDTRPWYTLDNPNVQHLADRLGEEMAQMFNLLFLSLPGSVTIYYGDEIGMMDHGRRVMKYFSHKMLAFNPLMPWTNDDSGTDSSPLQHNEDSHVTTNVQINSSPEETFTSAASTPLSEEDSFEEHSETGHFTTNVEAQLGLAHSHLSMVKRLVTVRQSEYAINYGHFELGPEDEDLLVVNVSSHLSTTHLIVLLHFGDQMIYDLTDIKFALNLDRRHVTLVAGTENLFRRGALVDRQRVDLTKIELLKNEALVVRVKKF